MTRQGIDHFTKEQFEDALPRHKTAGTRLWECAGVLDGEYVYTMGVTKKNSPHAVRIEIRSSVRPDNHSADTGDDSIRAWLIWYNAEAKEWQPLGSKTQRWINRLPGWGERLENMLRTLYSWRLWAGDCPVCGKPRGIYKVKSKDSPNVGLVFARCIDNTKPACKKEAWLWLDEQIGNSAVGDKPTKESKQ